MWSMSSETTIFLNIVVKGSDFSRQSIEPLDARAPQPVSSPVFHPRFIIIIGPG
jgi:hypothetical protein